MPQAYANLRPMDKKIFDNLARHGWDVIENAFPAVLIADLRADMAACDLKTAGIGRRGAVTASIRTDVTRWLTGERPAQNAYLAWMEELRRRLNEYLMLGLFDFEAHYARYEAGGFYQKHRDSLRGDRNRVVSTVTYLTPDWTEDDGGHLVLYAPDDHSHEIARVLPRAGTLALFLSEDIPHEVLPPARPRESIAGWFRVRGTNP